MPHTSTDKAKITSLRWFDILSLTAIMWGYSIYASTVSFVSLMQSATTVNENLEFSAADNFGALAMQAGLLALALLYLRLRRFDFSVWTIRPSVRAIACGVLVFTGGALLFDVYLLLVGPLAQTLPFPAPPSAVPLGAETASTVLYALLNGVYEELYFLGICLSVRRRDLRWALPFSLLVRVSFHTYQGLVSALGIGILFGGYMYLLFCRSHDKNLVPFFAGHALGDVFGMGLLWLFWG